MFLEEQTFKTIITNTPLVSIDLVVKNAKEEYLLGMRNNRPAKGFWFVPGGRVLKNESLNAAFLRLTEQELGRGIERQNCDFLGPYEHFYSDCVFGTDSTTHYIVLGYELLLDINISQLPNLQHSQYQWFTKTNLLCRKDVHEHSKWYLT